MGCQILLLGNKVIKLHNTIPENMELYLAFELVPFDMLP